MKRQLPRRCVESSIDPSTSLCRLASAAAATTAAARRSMFEALETRTLMSVAQDANGWTVVTPSADSRIIYVSSSLGDDANTGLSANAPKKTIAAGRSLLRSGYPDHLLLKRGDAWDYSFGNWSTSGRDADEPMVIGAYGTGARPLVRTGNAVGLKTNGRATHDLYVIGIHLYANGRDVASRDFTGTAGGNGLSMIGKIERFLLEDSVVDSFAMNVQINDYNGRPSGITIRRNTIVNSYAAPGSTSSGVYMSGVDGALIEGNVIDRNGWHPTLAGMNAYGHNVYLQGDTSGMRVIDNIIANGGSHGLQARSGGIITGNVFLRNPIHMSFGLVNSGPAVKGGVTGEIANNVFLEGRRFADPNTSRGEGWALEIANTKVGGKVAVRNNVFAHNNSGSSYAIRLDVGSPNNATEIVGLNDLLIEGNTVFKWYRGLWTNSNFVNGGTGPRAYTNVTVRNNNFQTLGSTRIINHGHAFDTTQSHWSGQRYNDSDPSSGWFSVGGVTTSLAAWKAANEPTAVQAAVTFKDPHRSMATYSARLGGAGTYEAFIAQAKRNTRTTWAAGYTARAAGDYIRDGFGMSAQTPPPTPPPLPPPPLPPPPPAIDTTPPTAAIDADRVATGDATSYTFTVTYADGSGIDVDTLDDRDLTVTDNNGRRRAAILVGLAASADGKSHVATYVMDVPGRAWDVSDNGTYRVVLAGGAVADTAGVVAPGATLGTFAVDIAGPVLVDTTPPTATIAAGDVKTAGGSSHTFHVTYDDDASGIDADTIDHADIRVTGPNGYNQLAQFVSLDGGTRDVPRTATYRIAAPGGTWDAADSGAFTIALEPGAVSNTSGAATAGGTLGTFQVTIAPPTTPQRDRRPPTVVRSWFGRTSTGGHVLSFTFSEDVSGSLSIKDLVLTNRRGRAISRSEIALRYDKGTNTAMFTFPGLRHRLGDGQYAAKLLHLEIHDASLNRLDGNSNGIPGPDYTYRFTV